jgi:hypothetical protein
LLPFNNHQSYKIGVITKRANRPRLILDVTGTCDVIERNWLISTCPSGPRG